MNQIASASQGACITFLFNKYRGPLYLHLRRLVPKEDATELVQETYFRLVRYGNMIAVEGMLRGFLFETATNLARDHHRRRASRRADRHVSLQDAEIMATEVGPPDHVMKEQTLILFMRALQGLSQDVRTVFWLCAFRGMNQVQVARLMGLSTRTIARKMMGAVAQLTAAMGAAV